MRKQSHAVDSRRGSALLAWTLTLSVYCLPGAAATVGAVNVTAGGSHTCVLMQGGQPVCFGEGNSGQLGTGNTLPVGDSHFRPLSQGIVPLPQGRTATSVSAGSLHTCMVLDNGDAMCFGDGGNGILGTEDVASVGDDPARPLSMGMVKLPEGHSAVSISAGQLHTCAVMDDGRALCWGSGLNGRLGTEATANVGDDPSRPLSGGIVQLPATRTAVSVSAGGGHTCAVLDNGDAVCFGLGSDGRLGTEDTIDIGDDPARPLSMGKVKLPGGHSAVSISAGLFHSCAVMDDGRAVCFGKGTIGRLGTEDTADVGDSAASDLAKGIVLVPGGRSVVSITIGSSHTCAVLEDGSALCFGFGGFGQLGNLAMTDVGDSPSSPLSNGVVQLPAGRSALSIDAGPAHTCAVLDDAQVVCFGLGSSGRLGTEAQDSVGNSAFNVLARGIVKLPTPLPTPSPSSSPSPTGTTTPSPSSSPSPSGTASPTSSPTMTASSTPSPTGSATPSVSPSTSTSPSTSALSSQPGSLGGSGAAAAAGSDDDSSLGAGPIAAVALVGTVAVGAAAYTVQRQRSTRRRRQARGVAKPKPTPV